MKEGIRRDTLYNIRFNHIGRIDLSDRPQKENSGCYPSDNEYRKCIICYRVIPILFCVRLGPMP
jgi:hypothetical protein